ncbi:hypothetical protein LguiA_006684 [Lonicera macranthoides]
MDGGIERQPPQYALLVRQEGFLLQILRYCPVHRVMQLVCRYPSSRARTRTRAGALNFPEARVLLHILVSLEQTCILLRWIFIHCSSF